MGSIRFLLAISVLIVHSGPIFSIILLPGPVAVRCFYIISGFYMAMVFIEKYSISPKPFYYFITNRIYKLYPLYALIAIMTALLSLIFAFFLNDAGKFRYYFEQYGSNHNSMVPLCIIMFTNIALIGQDIITFFQFTKEGDFVFSGLISNIHLQPFLFSPIAWTIAVELWFYFLTPFIAKKGLLFLIGLIIMILGLRMVFDEGIDKSFFIYRFAPLELFWFLSGIISYKLYFLYFSDYKEKIITKTLFRVLLVLLFFFRFYNLEYILYTFIFISTPFIFQAFKNYEFDNLLGHLCYPIYLGHCFFLLIISANNFPKQHGTGVPLLVLTMIFSLIVYNFFLKPIEKFRSKRIRTKVIDRQ